MKNKLRFIGILLRFLLNIFNIPYFNYIIIIALFITIKIYNVYNKNLHQYNIITTVGKLIVIKKIEESRKGKEKRNNI